MSDSYYEVRYPESRPEKRKGLLPVPRAKLEAARLEDGRECERLMGFPDDYTRIPWRGKPVDQCPDGPRYKALGNSWAVPVVRWIGERIGRAINPPSG